MKRLINYLKEKNIDFMYEELGFGLKKVAIENSNKRLYIFKDEAILGDCKYNWRIIPDADKRIRFNHSNFSHLTNTVIPIFLEKK